MKKILFILSLTLFICLGGIKVNPVCKTYEGIPVEAYFINNEVLEFCEDKGVSIKYYKKGSEEWEDGNKRGILGNVKFDPCKVTGVFKPLVNIYESGDEKEDIDTLIHELLHVFDRDYVSGYGCRISGNCYFYKVFKEERGNLYNECDSMYEEVNEYFAYCGAMYYTNKEELKNKLPKTYEYFKKLFEDNIQMYIDDDGEYKEIDIKTYYPHNYKKRIDKNGN